MKKNRYLPVGIFLIILIFHLTVHGTTERKWDKGDGITGSINNIPACTLCQTISISSTAQDKDHWHCSYCLCTNNDGIEYDQILYAWSKSSGGNPETGVFKSPTDQSSVSWQAPPTKGIVNILLQVRDKPNPCYSHPCRTPAVPGTGERNDTDPSPYSATADVKLPDGCEEGCSGGPGFSGFDHSNDNYSCPDDSGSFGEFDVGDFSFYYKFTYCNGAWKCKVDDLTSTNSIYVLNQNRQGYHSVSQASDVPCNNASQALGDLYDDNLSDDHGPPCSYYWCYNAVKAHEKKHRSDWEGFFGPRLEAAKLLCEGIGITIDCDNQSTWDCRNVGSIVDQELEKTYNTLIAEYFAAAWANAMIEFDDPNTTLNEADQRAHYVSSTMTNQICNEISALCGP